MPYHYNSTRKPLLAVCTGHAWNAKTFRKCGRQLDRDHYRHLPRIRQGQCRVSLWRALSQKCRWRKNSRAMHDCCIDRSGICSYRTESSHQRSLKYRKHPRRNSGNNHSNDCLLRLSCSHKRTAGSERILKQYWQKNRWNQSIKQPCDSGTRSSYLKPLSQSNTLLKATNKSKLKLFPYFSCSQRNDV